MARQDRSVLCWIPAIFITFIIFGLALSWLLLVGNPSLFFGDDAFWHFRLSSGQLAELELARGTLLDQTLNSTLGVSDDAQSSQMLQADSSNNQFGKIFVISMPAAESKRSSLSAIAEASNIELEFVDGVPPEDVDLESLPPGMDGPTQVVGYALGAYQAHMNTLDLIIERGYATAVIAEDDIDWDVRIKSQLRSAARAFQTLTQPFVKVDSSYDPHSATELDFDHMAPVQLPHTSPYGDDWDVLWLGLCRQLVSQDMPHIIRHDDPTVPLKHLTRVSDIDHQWNILENYADHTRIYHRMREGLCSLFYAVTLEGAKRIRHEFGDIMLSGPLDVMLLQYCNPEGRPAFGDKNRLKCYSPMPQIFNHWNPETGRTHDIRYSARVNLEELRARNGTVAEDDTSDVWIDSWPDDAEWDARMA